MIIHGDCRVELKKLKRSSVHLVLTDPPYFLDGLDDKWKKGEEKGSTNTAVNRLPSTMRFKPEMGPKLQEFIRATGVQMKRALKPGGFALVFSSPRLSHRVAMGLELAGFQIRDLYTWTFSRSQMKAFSMDHFIRNMDMSDREKAKMIEKMMGRKTAQFKPAFENIVLAQKPLCGTLVENWLKHKTGLADASGSPRTTFDYPKEPNPSHLTPKPVLLMRELINRFSIPGQTVLDPFLGSGAVAVAAKRSGRQFIGIEIKSEYVALSRMNVDAARFSDA